MDLRPYCVLRALEGPVPKRLLCVDDDAETLKQRTLLLEASGYSVVSTASARSALELLANGTTVDLVLLDYVMPEMNGDELARELRQKYPSLPLIAVSAVDPLPESFLRNVDGHLRKGQDPQVLLSEVAKVLCRSKNGPGKETVPQRTVLCVEDEELQLKARRMLFEAAGYCVLEARSAKGAIATFESSDVDVVVMDYWLSDQNGNGTAVAEQMKKIHPRTPIVMLSGFSALPGEGALVDSWMRKSQLEPENLLKEVDRLIELRTIHQHPDSPHESK